MIGKGTGVYTIRIGHHLLGVAVRSREHNGVPNNQICLFVRELIPINNETKIKGLQYMHETQLDLAETVQPKLKGLKVNMHQLSLRFFFY